MGEPVSSTVGSVERPTGRRGRPPNFSRAELIAAARRLGPDALSLPAIAKELGVSRTSLYWHVRDAPELGATVLADILDRDAPHRWVPDPSLSWSDELAALARSVHVRLLAAGAWMRFATPRSTLGRTELLALENLVGKLTACGFTADDAAHALVFVFQMVLANLARPVAPVAAVHRALLTGLDVDEFASLHALAAKAAATTPQDRFDYELDCALRGIADRSGVPLGAHPPR